MLSEGRTDNLPFQGPQSVLAGYCRTLPAWSFLLCTVLLRAQLDSSERLAGTYQDLANLFVPKRSLPCEPVFFAAQIQNPLSDFISNLAYRLHRLSFRIFERPVELFESRYIRARVATAHGHK